MFFAGYIRKVLDREAGGRSMLPTVALVGAGIFATGAAIDSMISFALAEAADDIDPTAVQAIQAMWDNDFMPLTLGICCSSWRPASRRSATAGYRSGSAGSPCCSG